MQEVRLINRHTSIPHAVKYKPSNSVLRVSNSADYVSLQKPLKDFFLPFTLVTSLG